MSLFCFMVETNIMLVTISNVMALILLYMTILYLSDDNPSFDVTMGSFDSAEVCVSLLVYIF